MTNFARFGILTKSEVEAGRVETLTMRTHSCTINISTILINIERVFLLFRHFDLKIIQLNRQILKNLRERGREKKLLYSPFLAVKRGPSKGLSFPSVLEKMLLLIVHQLKPTTMLAQNWTGISSSSSSHQINNPTQKATIYIHVVVDYGVYRICIKGKEGVGVFRKETYSYAIIPLFLTVTLRKSHFYQTRFTNLHVRD